MAYTYDYSTLTITIPQSDLTFISGTLYELDTNAFRLLVADEQDSERGMPYPDAIRHNTEVTVAGVTYARFIEIINGWNVTFENGTYSVRLVGSNNNIFDIANGILNQNTVQVIPTNSAGLIVAGGGGSLTAQQIRDAMGLDSTSGQLNIDTKLNNTFAVAAS